MRTATSDLPIKLTASSMFFRRARRNRRNNLGFSIAYQIALNRKHTHLYVSAPSGAVAEVTYPAGVLLKTITNSLGGAYGVATSPDGSR